MASIVFQLVAIILIATAVQIFANDDLEEYDDYEENDISYLKRLLNYLRLLGVQPQLDVSEPQKFNVETSGVEENYGSDERDSRSFGSLPYDPDDSLCRVVVKQTILSDENYEYRPSILEEKTCHPLIGEPSHNQKGLCYVRGRGCQTVYREVPYFRRQKHSAHCWKPEIRNVSDGCRCYFDRHFLRGKNYNG